MYDIISYWVYFWIDIIFKQVTIEVIFDFGFFFSERHINLRGLFNARFIFVEEQKWYYLIHSWVIRVFVRKWT